MGPFHFQHSENKKLSSSTMRGFSIAFAVFALPQAILGDLASDLQANGLTTLLKFVVDAGLADTLASVEPATIFAPTNEAFGALPPDVVSALTSDPELLKNTLLYHVIPNTPVPSSALKPDQTVATATGVPLRVNVFKKNEPVVTVNGVRVIKPDVTAGSGSIVHVVEKVLPTLNANDNVATILTKDGRFGTLLAAVKAAGLVDALSTTDGLTVFAPTDDAFAKVPTETLNFLLAPQNKAALTEVLTRHVVPQPIFAEVICWKCYPTLNEAETLKTELYKLRKGFQYVGSLAKARTSAGTAKIIDTDLLATNGVIHAIDTVI